MRTNQYHLEKIDDFAIAIIFEIIRAVARWIFMGMSFSTQISQLLN
ncbi:MAG: hypothetical protein V7K14_15415 [Nostoc sp.]